MTSRRGFLGAVGTLLAALPFMNRGAVTPAESGLPGSLPLVPAELAAFTPEYFEKNAVLYVDEPPKFIEVTTQEYAPAFVPHILQETPDALKLHEIMRLYKDGYIDTPTMRSQVRALFPLNAAKVEDGQAIAGKISTENDIRSVYTLNELTDVSARTIVRMPEQRA